MSDFNHSKSSIMTYFFCPYNFYQTKILKNRPSAGRRASEGSLLHHIFELFFYREDRGGIDYEILWDLDIERGYGTYKNEVYSYFMDTLFALMPDEYKADRRLVMNLKAFAKMQTNRWKEITYHFSDNKGECRKYFYPASMEYRLEERHPDVPRKLKGYVDVLMRAPSLESDGRERIRLVDYKTGRVPIGIKRERVQHPRRYYSKELPSKYVFEGNFYCLIYLLSKGYEFIKDDEGSYFLYLNGERVNPRWLEYEFVFTNTTEEAYRARKNFNLMSIRAAFDKMETIDNHYAEFLAGKRKFERDPNEYKCKFCGFFLEDCVYNMDEGLGEMIKTLLIPEEIPASEIIK